MTDRWKYFIEFQKQRHELEPRRLVVGRSRKSDLSIADPSASRRHVVLTPGEGLIKLEDLGSSNGTFINGERVEGTGILRHGDRLGLGDAEMTVEIEQTIGLDTVRLPTDDLAVAGAGVGEATSFLQAASVRLAQDALGDSPPDSTGSQAPPPAGSGQHMAPPLPPPDSTGQHMAPPSPEPRAPEQRLSPTTTDADPLRTARFDSLDLPEKTPAKSPSTGTPVATDNPLAASVLGARDPSSDPLLTARFDAGTLQAPPADTSLDTDVDAAIDPRMTARIDTSQLHPSSPEAQSLQTSRLSPEQLQALRDLAGHEQRSTPRPDATPPNLAPPVTPDPRPRRATLSTPEAPTLEPPDIEPPDIEPPDIEAPDIELPDIELPEIEPPTLEIPEIELPPQMQPAPDHPSEELPSFEAAPADHLSFDQRAMDQPTLDLPAFEAPESTPAPSSLSEDPLFDSDDIGLPTFEAPDFSTPAADDFPALDTPTLEESAFPPIETELPLPLPPPPAQAVPSPAEPAAGPGAFDQGAYVPPPVAPPATAPPPTPPLDVPFPSPSPGTMDLRDLAAQQAAGGGGSGSGNEMLSSLEGFDTTLGPGAPLPPSMQRAQENLARNQAPDDQDVETGSPGQNPYGTPMSAKPLAGFFIRAAAVFLDFLWMGGLSAAAAAVPIFLPDLLPGEIAGQPTAPLLAIAVSLFNILVVLVGWSLWGSTPGKRLTGIVVCDAQGKAGIGFPRAVVRMFGYFISSMLLGIGFLMVFGKSRKALHDHLAGTLVRRR